MTHMEDLKDFIDFAEGEERPVTSCQHCVFAIKEKSKRKGLKQAQTGCKIDKIEKYRNINVNIIEAHNEENEFYGIESWCNTYREEPWEIAHKGEDLLDVVRLETTPSVGFIILIKDNIDSLEKTINSVLNQEDNNASQIVIVKTGKEIEYIDLIAECRNLLEEQSIDYKVQDIFSGLPELESVDEAFKNISSRYYTVLESGKEAPEDLIKVIHTNVNDKLKNVGFIKGNDGINGLTAQWALHKYLYGNQGASLEKKLKEGEEHDKTTPENSLIHTWDELR